jgi:hypothetical protein
MYGPLDIHEEKPADDLPQIQQARNGSITNVVSFRVFNSRIASSGRMRGDKKCRDRY